MKAQRDKNRDVEQVLKAACPTGPSSQLKRQVIGAAKRAWRREPQEISWQVPLRRLAVSAAAAVLVVSLTNLAVDRSLVRWQAGGRWVASREPSDVEAVSEAVYAARVRYLVGTVRRASAADWREYREQMQRVLDEAQERGTPDRPAAPNGRSRLPSVPVGTGAFS